MSRRHSATKRELKPDLKHGSAVVSQFIGHMLKDGRKSTASRIIYGAIEDIREKVAGQDPIQVLERAIDNARPQLEVKSRRVGGATYQVPIEVNAVRGRSLAMRWIIGYAGARKGMGYSRALATELVDAFNNTGNAIKKRDDVHKMAQANRAFAHYRW